MGQSTPIQYDVVSVEEILEELFDAVEALAEVCDILREAMEDED